MGAALALFAQLPFSGELPAQTAWEAAIPVDQRFDPVLANYRPTVLEPLSPAAVVSIQQALATAGFPPGPVTGWLDNRTRAALRDFQASRGLRLSGRPDYDTVVALRLPLRQATPAEVANSPPSSRPYDVVIIGPADSLGPLPPVVDGAGVVPGAPGAPPPVSGSGANPSPEPGVTPVPEPGVEPAPRPGVPVLPAPGAAPGASPGMIVLPAPPPAPSSAAPDSRAANPAPAPAR